MIVVLVPRYAIPWTFKALDEMWSPVLFPHISASTTPDGPVQRYDWPRYTSANKPPPPAPTEVSSESEKQTIATRALAVFPRPKYTYPDMLAVPVYAPAVKPDANV